MPGPQRFRVKLAGGYYFATINRLIRDLQPLFEIDRRNERAIVEVDLRRLTFVGPCALALLVATLHRLRRRRLVAGGGIYEPSAPGIASYLHRIEFYKRLFPEQDLPDRVAKRQSPGMRECRRFPSDPDVQEWDTQLRAVVRELLGAIEETIATDAAAHTSLDIALSELIENVGYHAETRLGGFAAVQALRHTREIEVGIADLGVGIPASIRRSAALAPLATDDVAAINVALTATRTSTPWRNSGYGLTFAQLLLGLNEGRLLVRSGRGQVIRGAKNSDRIVDQDLPGTLVGMRLRTDRPLDFHVAYDLLDAAIAEIRKLYVDGAHTDDEAG